MKKVNLIIKTDDGKITPGEGEGIRNLFTPVFTWTGKILGHFNGLQARRIKTSDGTFVPIDRITEVEIKPSRKEN